MTSDRDSRVMSFSSRSTRTTEYRSSNERNPQPKRSLNDRTPLMDHPQDISKEALRALSYLLIVSIVLTLAGMCLIFFSDDIHDVLWEAISLLILGASATVVTVLPGAGPYIVDHWKDFKNTLQTRWRHGYFCDFCSNWNIRGPDDTPALTE